MIKNLFTRENLKIKGGEKMKKGFIIGLMCLMVLALTVPAKATIIVDNWTFDLSGVDGLAAGTGVSDIQQMTYFGVGHLLNVVDAEPAGVSAGDIGIFDGHLAATSYIDANTGSIKFDGLNSAYELTFDVTTASLNFTNPDPSADFVHIAPGTYGGETADGYLDIYVDNLGDGVAPASSLTGDGYTDGLHIARLINLTGDGGVFTPLTLDGSDDATFKVLPDCVECFVLPGIIWADTDGDGVLEDISLDPSKILAAITDNDFDADPTLQGDFSVAMPTNWANYFPTRATAGGNALDLYALEDGSTRIGYQIPEPSTMILIGSGLLGLGVYGRKRMKK